MRACIAIPYDDGKVFPKFGNHKEIKLYMIEEKGVESSEVLDMSDVKKEEIGVWLLQKGVNAVLCSEIDATVYGSLTAAGIPALAGITGEADRAIDDLLSGKLAEALSGKCGGCSGCLSCGSCGDGSCCQ